MRRKKSLTLLLLTSILVSVVFSVINTKNVLAENEARPRLESIIAEGFEGFNGQNYPNGTLITVEYSVKRYVGVDGVKLVGAGSNFTLDINLGLELNFSNSFELRSYYTGTFNLTEHSYFKAYGWIGDVTNGTYEEVDYFAHLGPWHYLFVNENLAPEFDKILNATSTDVSKVFYSPANYTNHTIVIRYKVYGGGENENITLATSVYRDKIANSSITEFDADVSFIKMDWVNETHETYEVYNTTILFTTRTFYFSANNSNGWDTWNNGVITDRLNIYRIDNGFHFESKTVLNEKHTEVNPISFNITSINATEYETFGISYYVVESSENSTEIVPWTLVEALLNTTYIDTDSDGYNSTIRKFNATIGPFNVGNIIYFEAYNIYKGEHYNETTGNLHRIEIYDSTPELYLTPIDGIYTNNHTVTFFYEVELNSGNITEATFDYGDGTPLDILSLESHDTLVHDYPFGVAAFYNYTLFVNNSLGTSNNITHLIYLDFQNPLLDMTSNTNTSRDIVDGLVELRFEYSDDYTGIKFVHIDWGDGIVQNVTDEHYALHYYVESGTYNVTITAQDRAGNNQSVILIYNVVLSTETPTEPTPNSFVSVLITLVAMGIVISSNLKLKKRK
ncbi:MAG: PKD domain-containing protein [Asgard group archaeon]|nr:PKD domain-containing protein [Asgard group archaeon]